MQGGRRGDLAGAACVAGFVGAGDGREVRPERLYCNALRLTYMSFFDPPVGLQLDLLYQELRVCLAPGGAVGFASRGPDSAVSVPLARASPEEWVSLLRSPGVEVQPDPRFAEVTRLYPEVSITDLPAVAAVGRLGYGGPGSRFVGSAPSTFVAVDYPGHESGDSTCRALYVRRVQLSPG